METPKGNIEECCVSKRTEEEEFNNQKEFNETNNHYFIYLNS